MSAPLTVSEAKFEEFLRASGLRFERVAEANTPRPDYLVTSGELQLMFEVKELTKDDNFAQGLFAVSSRTVGDHIRSKITQAREQVRFGAKSGIPSILLIYNDIDPLHLFGTEQHDFTAAMYGERTLLIQTGRVVADYQGRNKSFSQDKKTYFSALGRLWPCHGKMTVTLYENLFAALPVPYDTLPSCFEVVRCELAEASCPPQ
jgi:hypothetical protein